MFPFVTNSKSCDSGRNPADSTSQGQEIPGAKESGFDEAKKGRAGGFNPLIYIYCIYDII
jgi:hypothetical protein